MRRVYEKPRGRARGGGSQGSAAPPCALSSPAAEGSLGRASLYSAGVRTLIVGHGGRESALAARMAEHSELYAFAGHLNPSLVRYAESSGGTVPLGDVC